MSKVLNKKIRNVYSIIEKVLFFFFKLFHIEEEHWDKLLQFVKFALVGLSNFFISYGIYAIVVLMNLSYHLGNILGFVFSVLNAFYWNNKYVFKQQNNEKRVWWKALLKTYMSYAFSGLLLTEILLFFWLNILDLPELVGPILNLLITTPINFIINKLWAFKSKKIDE